LNPQQKGRTRKGGERSNRWRGKLAGQTQSGKTGGLFQKKNNWSNQNGTTGGGHRGGQENTGRFHGWSDTGAEIFSQSWGIGKCQGRGGGRGFGRERVATVGLSGNSVKMEI